jgi:LAO/AO transport system kinase
MDTKQLSSLANQIRSGHTRSIAKAISMIENGEAGASELLDLLSEDIGQAYRIGITGAPGSGKSSIVTSLTEQFIENDPSIGIVAVDPSSPFSGGALLGDRVRMSDLRHPGVFIRSMASRGQSGGLAPTSLQVCDLLDASGKDLIIIETVGTGQSDVDVKDLVDTTVLVLTPESGDSIQAMKAGIMEIGDIIVINKKDRGGADRVEQELRSIFRMRRAETAGDDHADPDLDESIVQTSVRDDENLDELFELIQERWTTDRAAQPDEKDLDQKRRTHLDLILQSRVKQLLDNSARVHTLKEEALDKIRSGTQSAYSAARDILQALGLQNEEGPPS